MAEDERERIVANDGRSELHKLVSLADEPDNLARGSDGWWDRRAQEGGQPLTTGGEKGEIWKPVGQSKFRPDCIGEGEGDGSGHVGLRYAGCSREPTARASARGHLVQMLKSAKNLIFVVLDPRHMNLL